MECRVTEAANKLLFVCEVELSVPVASVQGYPPLGMRQTKIEKMQEMFNKDLEELKNKQTEMNNTITEMKKIGRAHV